MRRDPSVLFNCLYFIVNIELFFELIPLFLFYSSSLDGAMTEIVEVRIFELLLLMHSFQTNLTTVLTFF